MSTNKLSDNEIWEAYREILSGKSLTQIAKENMIDRGTLRKYIERVVIVQLSEEEKQKFYEKINKGFKGNLTGEGRKGRNKKEKNLQSETYLMAKQKIQEYGIGEETVNRLYEILASKKNTAYAQGTYIIKLAEFLDYFTGKGLTEIQVIDMINRRPQIFTADIKNTIDPIIKILEKNNRDGVKTVYETPSEISKGKNKVQQGNSIIKGQKAYEKEKRRKEKQHEGRQATKEQKLETVSKEIYTEDQDIEN